MSDWDDEELEDSNLVKSLRKQLKTLTSERDSFKEELSTLKPQVRKTTLTSVLTDLGVNSKIAGLMPESLDATKEAVADWLKDYGELFNLGSKEETPPEVPPVENVGPIGQNTYTDNMANIWAKVQNGDSASGVATPDIEKQQMAQLGEALAKANGSFDQYIANLRGGNSPM